MIEKRWERTGCVAALLLGLLAARPAPASACTVDWNGDQMLSSADLNGDGKVDGVDLGMLLAQWGACSRCASDFNGDGIVDCIDEKYLLGNWGVCPEASGVSCADVGLLRDSLDPCTIATEWQQIEGGHYPIDFPSFDVDNDGTVDADDLNLVTCRLGSSWPLGTLPPLDVNLDLQVNQADLDWVEEAIGAICHDLNQDGRIGWPDVYVLIERWP